MIETDSKPIQIATHFNEKAQAYDCYIMIGNFKTNANALEFAEAVKDALVPLGMTFMVQQ